MTTPNRLELAAAIYAQRSANIDRKGVCRSDALMVEALAEADRLIQVSAAQDARLAQEEWERKTPEWQKKHPSLALCLRMFASAFASSGKR